MIYYAISRNGIEVPEYGTYCTKKTLILVMKKLVESGQKHISAITKFETFGVPR